MWPRRATRYFFIAKIPSASCSTKGPSFTSKMTLPASRHSTLCHRFLNALEPGTQVPVHHHVTKDETFILLRGRVRVNIYNDLGEVTESVVLSHEEGHIGVDIPKDTWHNVECLEAGSVIFEVKEGPFVEHEIDGILAIKK